uniref:Uncharacterized protein n=1 Tax=Cyprinodon variegatus TaxID=28743 RepID=A0A3Q2CYH3_CYPVA
MPEDRNNNRKKKKKKNKVSATDQKLKGKYLSNEEQLKDSKSLVAETSTASDSKEPAHVMELSVQARESLRWEGELQDPQEEAKRLERYRASRRQRYITHREALQKQVNLKQEATLLDKSASLCSKSLSCSSTHHDDDLKFKPSLKKLRKIHLRDVEYSRK